MISTMTTMTKTKNQTEKKLIASSFFMFKCKAIIKEENNK
jgi:hypothetical protein